MEQNNVIEFGKIYKRLMDVEMKLKERFIVSMIVAFDEKAFFRLIPYLEALSKTEKYSYKKTIKEKTYYLNYIKDLLNSKQKDFKKIKILTEILYLRDFLNILTTYKLIYNNPMFEKNFYCLKPSFNDVKKYSIRLANLRNSVMHFNFEDYEERRIEYVETLRFWEQQLSCFNSFIHELPKVKPIIKNILGLIYCRYPEIFNGYDRVLCEVYDDIAILNNTPAKDLPQYWSILRQKYQMLRKLGEADDFSIREAKTLTDQLSFIDIN